MKKNLNKYPLKSIDQIFDIFIRTRAHGFNDRKLNVVINDEPFLEFKGIDNNRWYKDDEWYWEIYHRYQDSLSSKEYLDTLEKIIKTTRKKYKKYTRMVEFITYIVAETFIVTRPTKKHYEIFPERKEREVDINPINLNKEEEKRLINIILELKKILTKYDKYRANYLIYEMTEKKVFKNLYEDIN